MDGWINGWLGMGWINEWMNRWVDGWLNRCVRFLGEANEWMDGLMVYIIDP